MVTGTAVGIAREIADEVLFPAAMAVDAADRVPPGHLGGLAAAGLYGLVGPVTAGGLEAGPAAVNDVTEALASGCLTTTFVWLQHHRAVRAAATAPAREVRDAWLEPLCRGDRRAGVALGGARPGPAALRARPVAGGYRLDGTSPWVTGWGMIDTLYTVARSPRGDLVTALLAAEEGPTLRARRLALVAVNASGTVQLRFDGHFVPAARVVDVISYADWVAADARALRANGSLSLGVAARCCALAGLTSMDSELSLLRAGLDEAGPEAMPAARAAAAAFVLRAAGALVAETGSRAVLAGEHPQRLAREALFLLVFGSRPAIKEHLVQLLGQNR